MLKSKVKYIQSLSQKKQRDSEGVFVAEGPKIIDELLRSPDIELVELFALGEWIAERGLTADRRVVEIDEILLKRISFLQTPHKVLGIFKKPAAAVPDLSGRLTLAADGIQDPGNLGTLIRCADWFGVDHLLCSRDCADAYGPKTVQSAMGSIARVRVIYDDLAAVFRRQPSVCVYAATLSGKDLRQLHHVREGVLVVGNESRGVSETLLQLAHEKITIPGKGGAESLNAALAAGIILSHIADGLSVSG